MCPQARTAMLRLQLQYGRRGVNFTIEGNGEPFAVCENEIETGIAKVTGSLEAVSKVIDSFDKVANDQTTPSLASHAHETVI
jgi:hypothetical protein